MRLLEIDMSYFERKGKSKLKVVRDGFRFLRVILEALLLYHPARPFALTGLVCLAIASVLMAAPVAHYWKTRTVEEWMLYRFILGHLAASSALLMFSVALLSRRVVQITVGAKAGTHASSGWLYKAFLRPLYWLAPGLLIVCGIAFGRTQLTRARTQRCGL